MFRLNLRSWMYLLLLGNILSESTTSSQSANTSCTAGNTECSNSCNDLCLCKRLGCEYHSHSTNCYPRDLQCYDHHFAMSTDCQRPNVIYSFGGDLCKSETQTGPCSIEETILAVNLFGDKVYSTRGIVYQPGSNIPPTLGGQHVQQWNLKEHWDGTIFGVSAKDQSLFLNMMTGNSPGDPGKCTSYTVSLSRDGRYELSVRTLDGYFSTIGKHQFTIKFAGIEVFPEIDVVRLADSINCHAHLTALELAVNFKVTGGGTWIQVSGFEPVALNNANTLLEFCFSQCPNLEGIHYAAAAFSVVRFGKDNDYLDCPCWHDICECKHRGCEFSPSSKSCTSARQDCSTLEIATQASNFNVLVRSSLDCRREGALYSVGGVICQNLYKNFSCEIEETVIAVNLGGEDVTDSRGISYEAGESVSPVSGGTYGLSFVTPVKIHGALAEDIPIFNSVMYGTWPWSTEKCVAYEAILSADGFYELSVKALDGVYNTPGKRLFTIKFAGLDVFPEIDLVNLANVSPDKAKYMALDLTVNFMFAGGTVEVDGFVPVKILNGKTLLELCYSQCTIVDPKFAVAGFAVVRLGAPIPPITCSHWLQDMCACKKHGCEYNTETGACSEVSLGCQLSASSGNDTGCQRADVWYSIGGVVCQYLGNDGICKIDETAVAVNFGGEDVTDSRGILHLRHTTIPPVYGETCVSFFDPYVVHGVLPQDDQLFHPLMHGYQGPGCNETCVAYAVPLHEDGLHELSIKTMDAYFYQKGIRYFTIKFGGVEVFPEIDLSKFVSASPHIQAFTAIELAVNFLVSDTSSRLEIPGFNPISILGQETLVEFCFSSCQGIQSSVFVVAAFSVIRFESNDYDNCTEGQTDVCPTSLFTSYSLQFAAKPSCILDNCGRGMVWYSFGGLYRFNTNQIGACDIDKVILAINFAGTGTFTSSRGIPYESDTSRPPDSGDYSRVNLHEVGRDGDTNIYVHNPADRPLYDFVIVGFYRPAQNPGLCLGYNVPLIEDGLYELSVLSIDDYYMSVGRRSWSVKFGGIVVMPDIDLISMAIAMNIPNYKPSKIALDLSINFLVSNNGQQITLNGFKPVDIVNGAAMFEVCCGCLGVNDDHWHLGAFSVVKFK